MRRVFWIALLVAIVFPAVNVWAGVYNNNGPWVSPNNPADVVWWPSVVPGKEYSDRSDKEAPASGAPVLDSLQTIHWDGYGGREDGLDYTDSAPALDGEEVDAMANTADALFAAVVANQVPVIVSLVGDTTWDAVTTDYPLLYEKASGTRGNWATDAGTVPNKYNVDQEGVNDLDGIELWGEDNVMNANRFSLLGDPSGVAVYNLDGTTAFTDNELAVAIATQLSLNPTQLAELEAGMDVDAIMVDESGTSDMLLFSISQLGITGYSFVGDEVWVYNQTTGTAVWFNHGGHLWDTNWSEDELGEAFDIDGLEAVPEPGTLCLLGIGGIFALYRKKR